MSREYPEPLQPVSPFNPAGWSLPATTLSALSMATLLLVPLALQSTQGLRSSFSLPVPAWVPLWIASALAAGVAWRCRFRPGLMLPRFWALGLAALCALLGGMAFHRHSPWLSALGAGALASSLIMLGRLLRLRPDDKLVARLPSLVIGLVALYVPLLLWAAGSQDAPPIEQAPLSALQEEPAATQEGFRQPAQ